MLHSNRSKHKVTPEEETWPAPIPCILFEAKQYKIENYQPLTIPLLSSEIWKVVEPFVQSASKNGLVDKKNPFAWTEYISTKLLNDDNSPISAEQQGILFRILFSQVVVSKSCENGFYINDSILSPVNEHRLSMKFVTIHRKERPPNNMAVGGLPMEIRVTHLLQSYIPPSFGNFICSDKEMIVPDTSSKTVTSSSFEREQLSNYRYNDIEELTHALNTRIAPTIMIVTGMANPDEKYHYGVNRPKQTGEECNFGFRTSENNDIEFSSSFDDAILPTSFIPSHDIVTFNSPTEHISMIMRADNHYPFREPKSRTRTTQDFRHLLLINNNKPISPRNKPQIFTTIGVQESGQYMRQSDSSRPLGFFRSKVIRSWAYVQQQSYRVHEYETECGTSYWYDKTTKEVYKTRPKFQEENVPIREGGIIIIDDKKPSNEENKGNGRNFDGEQRDFFRKMIMFSHETKQMRRIREKAARKHGLTPKIIQEQEHLKQLSDDNDGKNEKREGIKTQKAVFNQRKGYEINENNEDNDSDIIKSNDMKMERTAPRKSTSSDEEIELVTLSSNSVSSQIEEEDRPCDDEINKKIETMIQSLSEILDNNLKSNTTSSQDMLKLGMGIGISLKTVLEIVSSPNKATNTNTKKERNITTATEQSSINNTTPIQKGEEYIKTTIEKSSVNDAENSSASPPPDPIGLSHPPKDLNLLDHSEEEDQLRCFEKLSNSAPAPSDSFKLFVPVQPTALPTEEEEAKSSEDTNSTKDATTNRTKITHVTTLTNLASSLSTARACKQYVDYIHTLPNIPVCKAVGRVKAKSIGNEWAILGFDPWSAGREPLSQEFIPTISIHTRSLCASDKNNNNKPNTQKLYDEDEEQHFMNIMDAQEQQTRQQVNPTSMYTSKTFKELARFIRHNKYTELQSLLDEMDYSFPMNTTTDELGNTLLMISCQNGNKRACKLCLRMGSDINQQNLRGQTCLHFAFGYGFDQLGEYLISKGADDRIVNSDGLTCYEGLNMDEVMAI